MRYIRIAKVEIKQLGDHAYTTSSVVRHFLDHDSRFLKTGHGVRLAIAIDEALIDADERRARWVALEDAAYDLLSTVVEAPEGGFPEIQARKATGEVVARYPVARYLGPILTAIFEASKKKPEDFDVVDEEEAPAVAETPQGA